MKKYAILIDTSWCTGCNTCAYRCIQEFKYHNQAQKGLFRTIVTINDDGLYHRRCMHCMTPECVRRCPVKALTKSEYGPVLYDIEKCIGCKTCVKSCPFGIPQYDEETKKIIKCSLCAHRIVEGKEPVCVEACPTGALQFGEYSAIMAKAKNIATKEKMNLYGIKEAMGTSTFVLIKGDPLKAGYPKMDKKPVKTGQAPYDRSIPVPIIAGIFLGGLKKLSDRKIEIALEKEKHT